MEYINLNQLRHFYSVAKYESYTKAAKELNIQQPALSKTIKNLEEDLDSKLFQKSGRNITLTHKGLEVFNECHNIFNGVKNIINSSKENELLIPKTLNICSNDAIASTLLPEALVKSDHIYSGLRPTITCGTTDSLLEKISSKNSDIGFFFHTPKLSKELNIVRRIPIEFKLVIAKKFKNSLKTIESFIGSREVDNLKANSFPTVKKMKKIWPNTKINFSTNNFATHKKMVASGLGVSILPKFFIQKELKDGSFSCLLPEEQFFFDLKIVCRKNQENSFDTLIDNFSEFYNSL